MRRVLDRARFHALANYLHAGDSEEARAPNG